jgi:Uma2 family endonuclease
MALSEKLYTWEEFEEYAETHPDALLELIDGRIVEKATNEKHGKISVNIGAGLRA